MCVCGTLLKVQCATKEKNNLACLSVITTWPRYHVCKRNNDLYVCVCVCVWGGGGLSLIQNVKVLAGGTMAKYVIHTLVN